MTLANEGISNLKILLNIDEWLLKRDFKELESAIILFQVNPQVVWQQIQKNPNMSEKNF